jgi:HTH-type transcriptional regulator / antitoxin HipB
VADFTTPIHSIRDLAAVIRGRRKDLGISQAVLAERAGVSRKWVYEFEAGKPTAEFGLLLRVIDALDLQLTAMTRSASPGAERDGRRFLDALIEEHRG